MLSLLLCGGAGTRLWPLSRQNLPKQFYPLLDQGSLFQSVITRNLPFSDRFAVASGSEQAFLAFEQLSGQGISEKSGLLEPVGRKTAPAVTLVALSLDPQELLLVSPTDHLVLHLEQYNQAVRQAQQLAREGFLVTFGVKPSYPETGYGYLEYKGKQVVSFHEKPDAQSALRFSESGNHLWNTGIFCFSAKTFLDEMKKHAPQIFDACQTVYRAIVERNGGRTPALLEPTLAEMESIPSLSVDYAVMEKSDRIVVVPCDLGWSDLGSFDSLYQVALNSETDNAVLAGVEPLFIESRRNLVVTPGSKKIVLIDMQDTCVVDTVDALLVMKRGSGQRVTEVVQQLAAEGSSLLDEHTTVQRPWGSYTILLDTDRVKVKRLVVQSGRRISLQKHRYREEHWVCADGIGTVTLNDDLIPMERAREVHIPSGAVHRLENTGTAPLVIIETQIGTYFGEDDIIRLEDDYKRVDSAPTA